MNAVYNATVTDRERQCYSVKKSDGQLTSSDRQAADVLAN